MKKIQGINNYILLFIINIYILIHELVFSFFTYKSITIYTILFSILYSLIIYLVYLLLKKKIILYILFVLISIIFIINYIYYINYNTIVEINIFLKSFSVLKYSDVILEKFLSNKIVFLYILLPIIFGIVIKLIKDDDKYKKFIFSLCCVTLYIFIIILLMFNNSGVYSRKKLYFNNNIPYKSLCNFGLLTSIRLDIQKNIFKYNEKTIIINTNDNVYDQENYNILNIEFKSGNNEVNEINNYIKNSIPTQKNIYTGLFKNKNLIFILAESFNTIAIDEKLTPNLYYLFNNGYTFNNYYNSLFPVSTADAQYLTDISLYPSDITHSLVKCNNNYYPYSLANQFKNRGYNTYSYHNYLYDYYSRDKYYPNMGFDVYKAEGKGLNLTYRSDYEMAQKTMDEYINDDYFFVYYLTYSGHASYSMSNDNVKNNIYKLKKYDYPEELKNYLSTQTELDNMIGYIFKKLKDNNKLDDTVIVLLPDHLPFMLDDKNFSILSKTDINDEIEKYKSSMVIYNSEINKYNSSDNYCSNIDMLPTLLNLYGFDYDSRLLIGKDILSNNNGTVIFGSRDMISKEFKYYNRKEYITNKNINIEDLRNDSYVKFRISRLILENDYYKILLGDT